MDPSKELSKRTVQMQKCTLRIINIQICCMTLSQTDVIFTAKCHNGGNVYNFTERRESPSRLLKEP